MNRNKTECFCINLRRTTTAVTNKYDTALKECDITINQFSILKNIDRLNSCDIIVLAKNMGLERTTLLRNIKPLIKRGIVIEVKDRKKMIFSLSDKGKKILEDALKQWNKVQKEIREILQEEESMFLKTLNKLEEIK